MVDFANKHLGGGVLKNGCVQEEILFAIFPELLVTRLVVSSELEDNEAVIVYGARRFSEYEGYSDSFIFKREYPIQPASLAYKSVIVAIDATDLSHIPSETYQYSKKGVRRELHKAFAGFEGAAL
jgi:poly(ADP-ribose) glycohydrolase